MITVRTKEELDSIVDGSENVLVKVGSGCCGPCNLMHGIINDVESVIPSWKFCEINDDDCEESLIDQLDVEGIPLLIFYANGKEVRRNEGVMLQPSLISALREISE